MLVSGRVIHMRAIQSSTKPCVSFESCHLGDIQAMVITDNHRYFRWGPSSSFWLLRLLPYDLIFLFSCWACHPGSRNIKTNIALRVRIIKRPRKTHGAGSPANGKNKPMGFAFRDSDSQTLEIFLVFRWFPLVHDQEAKTIKGYCMTSVMQFFGLDMKILVILVGYLCYIMLLMAQKSHSQPPKGCIKLVVNNGLLTISAGEGFLPSTVVF